MLLVTLLALFTKAAGVNYQSVTSASRGSELAGLGHLQAYLAGIGNEDLKRDALEALSLVRSAGAAAGPSGLDALRPAIGRGSLCPSSFVTRSFSLEELQATEGKVFDWLMNVGDSIEAFNNKKFRELQPNPLARLDDRPHGQRFEVVMPAEGPQCLEPLMVFGHRHDTEKPICNVRGRLLEANSTPGCDLISIGSNNQWDTEVSMHDKTKCRIHTFDCTSRDSRPKEIRDRTNFYKHCVSDKDSQDAVGRSFLSWPSLLRQAGIQQVPEYVKMDIEGFEYGVLRSMLRSKTGLPNQIAMEIHHWTYSPESGNPAGKLSWSNRSKDAGELLGFFLTMYASGYRLTYVDHKTHCTHCREVLWSRIFC